LERKRMTFNGKFLRFECNICHKIEDVSHGLPDGWEWYPLGVMGVGHKCTECLERGIGEDNKG